MALSFLSGDAGTPNNIKALEARAYAMEAAKNLKKLQNLEAMSENLEFLGLDEISKETVNIQQQRQPRATPSAPTMAPVSKPSVPALPMGPTTARQAAPTPSGNKPSKARTEGPLDKKLSPDAVKKLNVSQEEARKQVEENKRLAAEAAEAAQEQPEPTGFFQGKNLYIIGGVALAAIAGIYFLTKKK
jgi:hypothetical protein